MNIILEDLGVSEMVILAERLCSRSSRHCAWLAGMYSNTWSALSELYSQIAAEDEIVCARFTALRGIYEIGGEVKPYGWENVAESRFAYPCQSQNCHKLEPAVLPCDIYYKTMLYQFFLYASTIQSNQILSEMWNFAADLQESHRVKIMEAHAHPPADWKRITLEQNTPNHCPWRERSEQKTPLGRKITP